LADLVRQHDKGNQIPADAEEGRDAALAPSARLRSAHTSQGEDGGAVGHAALQVLHTVIFDFLNFASCEIASNPDPAQLSPNSLI
jgi:hypothetical protein